jgi:hypothetical protein
MVVWGRLGKIVNIGRLARQCVVKVQLFNGQEWAGEFENVKRVSVMSIEDWQLANTKTQIAWISSYRGHGMKSALVGEVQLEEGQLLLVKAYKCYVVAMNLGSNSIQIGDENGLVISTAGKYIIWNKEGKVWCN